MTRLTIPLTEAQLQKQITDLAELLGWQWMHIERMGNVRGQWRTPVTGPLGKGWPDLVLTRRGTMIFAELKAPGQYPSEAQKHVLSTLTSTGRLVYVWRLSDWNSIVEVLSNA